MYEKPEEISLKLINASTSLAVAALNACSDARGFTTEEIKTVFISCGDCVHDRFEQIRQIVDEHSSTENTELLTIKLNLLKLTVEAAISLLENARIETETADETVIYIADLMEKCVAAISSQYEQFQTDYFHRNPGKRIRRL